MNSRSTTLRFPCAGPTLSVFWPVLLCLFLASCSDTSIQACFGDDAFCDRLFGRNQPPIADAGADQVVGSGDQVTLDGSASRDPDGTIATYSWTQQDGPAVAIDDATRAVAGFVAPDVADEVQLRFRLVVTDNRGASDSDRVDVTVVPAVSLALQHGVILLEAVQEQAIRNLELTCAECAPRLGLWLGARALAAEAGADRRVDDLLDVARTLTRLDSERLEQALLSPAERRLFELGHAQLAHFTRWRDPATAERAGALAGATSSIGSDQWQAAMLEADPNLARRLDADPAELTRWLRREAAEASPSEIAAAVILLAQTQVLSSPHPHRGRSQ